METVASRGDQNTRSRDYYDIFILTKLQAENIEMESLKAALLATAEKRGSLELMKQYREIMQAVKNSEVMKRQWKNYRKEFDYALGIEFEDTCDAVVDTMDRIYKE